GPQAITRSDRVDDECVAVPLARRVAVPRRIRIDWKRAAVDVDLAELHVAFVQDHEQAWHLEDLLRKRMRHHLQRTDWQAARVGVVFGEISFALRIQFRGPWLIRWRCAV